MLQVGNTVILAEENCNYIGNIIKINSTKIHRGPIEVFFTVDWRYDGNRTKYDTAPETMTDIHFQNELQLA